VKDREKVIKAFEFCLMPPSEEEFENDVCSHEDCPYYREYNGGKCISALASDALVLLKAQEPVKPTWRWDYAYCGECGFRLHWMVEKNNYCPNCGRAVKWDG
jgi:hypothetical protein